MRRRDEPHVHAPDRRVAADRLDLATLGEAEQHGLHPQAHFAELVEKERAAVGLPHEADLVAIRAREAAAHVAEELGLEQRFRDAAAVHRHERASPPASPGRE